MTAMDKEFDDNDAICPRCKNRYEVESENYEEYPRVEECAQPDCELNDVPHEWAHGMCAAGEYWQCSTCSRLVVRDPERKQ